MFYCNFRLLTLFFPKLHMEREYIAFRVTYNWLNWHFRASNCKSNHLLCYHAALQYRSKVTPLKTFRIWEIEVHTTMVPVSIEGPSRQRWCATIILAHPVLGSQLRSLAGIVKTCWQELTIEYLIRYLQSWKCRTRQR